MGSGKRLEALFNPIERLQHSVSALEKSIKFGYRKLRAYVPLLSYWVLSHYVSASIGGFQHFSNFFLLFFIVRQPDGSVNN
jgi:hypothetical protein